MREYKHRITTIVVSKNRWVTAFDQNVKPMPFFYGPKNESMPRIKRRLERQKGKVKWIGVENLK